MSLPIEPASPHLYHVPRRRRSLWIYVLIALLLLSGIGGGYAGYWLQSLPNSERVLPYPTGIALPISYQGEWMEVSARIEDGQIYVPLDLVNQWVEPDLVWDEGTSSVIFTATEKVVRMETDQLTAYVNDEPTPLRYPITKVDQVVYVPMDPIAEWVGLSVRQPSNSIVTVRQQGETLLWGRFVSDPQSDKPHAIRRKASLDEPVVADAYPGDPVVIRSEKDGWYLVETVNGVLGYVQKNQVEYSYVETIQVQREDQRPYLAWRPIGGKIHMTWEYVYSKSPDLSKVQDIGNLNVVSPTWFELLDGEGNIASKADLQYVRAAHQKGLQVWGLFSNGFEPDRTNKALATYESRKKMTQQLLAYAEMYELDGINIDFENVYLKDKEELVQWVKEMTPLLHEQGLVVSIDVTKKSSNETWSRFYDRKTLGSVVDYVILMAYDEYWASSPVSGSVSSLPWAEEGIRELILEEDVPPSKIILGVPFYTRLWTEELIDGKVKVQSKALSMDKAASLIAQNKAEVVYLDKEQQNFATWEKDGVTYKIWIEDPASMAKRIDLVQQYRLAGVASWRRGFEQSGILPLIAEQLKKRP